MSYYTSPIKERMARHVVRLRKQGFTRFECVVALEQKFNRPNEYVFVDAIFESIAFKAAEHRATKHR